MTIQQSIEMHNSIIDSNCDTIGVFVLGVTILKTRLQITQEGDEEQF